MKIIRELIRDFGDVALQSKIDKMSDDELAIVSSNELTVETICEELKLDMKQAKTVLVGGVEKFSFDFDKVIWGSKPSKVGDIEPENVNWGTEISFISTPATPIEYVQMDFNI